MSAFGGKAEVFQGIPNSPLIAKSGYVGKRKLVLMERKRLRQTNRGRLSLAAGVP